MNRLVVAMSTLIAFVAGAASSTGAIGFAGQAAAYLGPSAPSHAATGENEPGRSSGAVVIAWNKELLKIVQTPGAQPATVHPTRSFAILHAAIYDAVVSITRQDPAYLFSVSAPRGARADAAAAQAGHDTLAALYPAFKPDLDSLLASELALIPAGTNATAGVAVGHTVAAIILDVRAGDGSAATPAPFVAGTAAGDYRPTPPAFPAPVFTSWGSVRPFVLDSATQFQPAAPPAVTSSEYAAAINEAKSLGQNVSTTRTADETVAAKFWAGPIWNTWNEIADSAALEHHTSLETTARLLAVLNLAFADSAISFYAAKYNYLVWRPITAIRLGDTIGNPAITGDPTWTPLATTPADPSYPGAHSTISAAGAVILTSFFGDPRDIQVTSDVLKGTVRDFNSYDAIATEAGLSRIFAGVHTRLDHVAGLALGTAIAHLVLTSSRSGQFGAAAA
jgi:membrane-associated phospholipid phosphatase